MTTEIRPDELLARCQGDRDVAGALLDIFATCARSELASVQQAAADHDWQTLRSAAHSLKGAAGNVSAHELYALAAKLEEDYPDDDNQPLETLLPEVDRLREAIDRCLATIPAVRVEITVGAC